VSERAIDADLSELEAWDGYLAWHFRLVGRKGLPDPATREGAEKYAGWHWQLLEAGVSLADLEAATLGMQAGKGVWGDDHLATLRAGAEAARRARLARAAAARLRPVDHATFDREAAAAWEALPEADRAAMRQKVRDRFPMLAHRAGFVEAVAVCWHHDPAALPAEPPPLRPPPTPRPRRIPGPERAAPNVYALPGEAQVAPENDR
jgi:hypothetical protein